MSIEEKTLTFEFGIFHGDVHTSSGLRHGWGVLTYHSGNIYEGNWDSGSPHGEGTKRYQNGDYYFGNWERGKRCGKGEYHHVQGDMYVGEYADDVCHGHGKLLTRNGDSYVGEWAKGRKHGSGIERLCSSGQTFEGTWTLGKKNGSGALTTTTERIVGVWANDKLVDITSRQEMEYQPQVRPMVTSSLSMSDANSESPDALLLAPNTIDDMRRAGADEGLVNALNDFTSQMTNRMGSLMGGIGAMEMHLASLTDTVEVLAGMYDGDDGDLNEGMLDGIDPIGVLAQGETEEAAEEELPEEEAEADTGRDQRRGGGGR